MSVQWKPLAIYSPEPVDLEPLKAAKAALELPYRCVPTEVQEGTLDERVIAIGERPPFLCSYALVTPRTTPDNLQAVVAWALFERDDDRAMTIEDCLGVIFGPGVREILQEELDSEQRYADYEAGF
jgi:hypothetical protein